MIEREFGSVQAMQEQLSALSIAVQGSGWGWLVRQLNGVLYVEYIQYDPLENVLDYIL